jgi:hypothetical protein
MGPDRSTASAFSVWAVEEAATSLASSAASSAKTGTEMPATKSTLAVPQTKLRQVKVNISLLLPDHVGTSLGRTPIESLARPFTQPPSETYTLDK